MGGERRWRRGWEVDRVTGSVSAPFWTSEQTVHTTKKVVSVA